MDQVVARDVFVPNPRGGFPQPRPPFRMRGAPRPLAPAPTIGEHDSDPDLQRSGSRVPAPSAEGAGSPDRLPLAGLKVLEFTTFWAGPIASEYLASMGADVIKVESVQRADSARFNVTVSPTEPDWYEQGYLYNSVNLGKRAITLNLGDPAGREVALRLVAQSDVVLENFTPRVMDGFGLDYDAFARVRPDIIVVRMPGFGLDGPWRDRPGFATTMEQMTGMAWITGYRDRPPLAPNGACDPIAGMHAAFAILVALEHRRRTGEGQQVEVPMIDVAVNIAEEQVAEFAAYGRLMERDQNRGPLAAPQGVYACAGDDDSWVALAVATDAQWAALTSAVGDAPWASDAALATAAGRRAAHDGLDAGLAGWCNSRPLEEVLDLLRGAGVPAEPVVPGYDVDRDPQMNARGFFEEVEHPIVGNHRFLGWPFRLSSSRRYYRGPAPLFNQHTDEVLGGELGLTAADLAELRERQVIGDRPIGA
jgi:crotonobetainyl-CoA:carnitine CoA-transferase CaiB-like acyl-CoA transferase